MASSGNSTVMHILRFQPCLHTQKLWNGALRSLLGDSHEHSALRTTDTGHRYSPSSFPEMNSEAHNFSKITQLVSWPECASPGSQEGGLREVKADPKELDVLGA